MTSLFPLSRWLQPGARRQRKASYAVESHVVLLDPLDSSSSSTRNMIDPLDSEQLEHT